MLKNPKPPIMVNLAQLREATRRGAETAFAQELARQAEPHFPGCRVEIDAQITLTDPHLKLGPIGGREVIGY